MYDKAAAQRVRRQRKIDAGLCPRCSVPIDREGGVCNDCLQKQRDELKRRSQLRRASGLCCECGNLLEEICYLGNEYPRCVRCFFKGAASNHLKDKTQWQLLRDMFFVQTGTCAYTGTKLILGLNACLDHIVPKAKGGKNEITNFQWVTKTVNLVKRDLLHDEFVELCCVIAARHGENHA